MLQLIVHDSPDETKTCRPVVRARAPRAEGFDLGAGFDDTKVIDRSNRNTLCVHVDAARATRLHVSDCVALFQIPNLAVADVLIAVRAGETLNVLVVVVSALAHVGYRLKLMEMRRRTSLPFRSVF